MDRLYENSRDPDSVAIHLGLHCLLIISTIKISGPSCSKLTTSLVNDSLKFTLSDMQIC